MCHHFIGEFSKEKGRERESDQTGVWLERCKKGETKKGNWVVLATCYAFISLGGKGLEDRGQG